MDPSVGAIALAPHEPVVLERLHDPRHRRWAHLLGGGQLPERARTAEDEHRERGELRGWDAGDGVLPAHVPQCMDGGRVEAVGRVD